MEAITTRPATRATRKAKPKPLYDGKKMPLDEFLDFKAEDGFKYEWKNGALESTEHKMKTSELLMVARLQEAFKRTAAARNGGMLMAETKVVLETLHRARIPDLAFFTKEQMEQACKGVHPVPTFVIELISPNDRFKYYDDKLAEYFASGVQTVWLLDKEKKRVWVFSSPKDARICVGEDICSAAPAIPDFQISVNQIFGEQ